MDFGYSSKGEAMKKVLFTCIIASSLFAQSQMINKDWSLNGLGISEAPLHVSTTFSNASQIATIWKYSSTGWQAYSPDTTTQQQLSNAGITTLTTINSGEGYWVNAKDSFSITISPNSTTPSYDGTWSGTAVTSISYINGVSCSNASLSITILSSQITGSATSPYVSLSVNASISQDGTINNGAFVLGSQNAATFGGKATSTSSISGTWQDGYGCYGTYALTKSK